MYFSSEMLGLVPQMREAIDACQLRPPEVQAQASEILGYTPEDIESEELVLDDRPYAGRVYIAMGFHSKKAHRQSSWEFNVGILGPASLAEDAQKLVHRINSNKDPQGWDNQLENELTFDAIFSTQWKIRPSGIQKKFTYEFLPHIGASLGTVNIYTNVGGEFRFGWNIPDDFGTCTIRAGCEVNNAFEEKKRDDRRLKRMGLHFFVAADGKMVFRDIYLDGNTFRDSHSVDKELFVADLIAGISVCYERVKMTYSYVQRTKQFKGQDDGQAFSSLNISLLF